MIDSDLFLRYVFDYLTKGSYPEVYSKQPNLKRSLRRAAKDHYRIVGGQLQYRAIKKVSCDISDSETEHNDKGFSLENQPWRIVLLTKEQRENVMQELHGGRVGGHLGREKTRLKISTRYYWPNMSEDIKLFVTACDRCQRVNSKGHRVEPELHPIPVTEPQAWFQIGMDLIGPLEETPSGFKYILTCTCYFSKWAEAHPLKSKSAVDVAVALYAMFVRLGFPRVILSDQGREFNNKVMEEICRILNIGHRTTSAYHPQCNGLTEIFNGTLERMLIKQMNEAQNDWDDLIKSCVFAYNTAVQTSTKYTPFFLMYGREPLLPSDSCAVGGEETDALNGITQDLDLDQGPGAMSTSSAHAALDKVKTKVLQNIQTAQTRQKEGYDSRRKQQRNLQIGAKVLLRNNRKHDRKGGSLLDSWLGPYTIVTQGEKGSYQLKNKTGHVLKKRYNGAQLKLYVTPDVEQEHEEQENEDREVQDHEEHEEQEHREREEQEHGEREEQEHGEREEQEHEEQEHEEHEEQEQESTYQDDSDDEREDSTPKRRRLKLPSGSPIY